MPTELGLTVWSDIWRDPVLLGAVDVHAIVRACPPHSCALTVFWERSTGVSCAPAPSNERGHKTLSKRACLLALDYLCTLTRSPVVVLFKGR